MYATFRPNIILHIEDDRTWRDRIYELLTTNDQVKSCYGPLKRVESVIDYEVNSSDLEKEIRRIEETAADSPTVVGIVSGQVARKLLETTLPGVIISDIAFPMNGQKIVKWVLSHGLSSYALIGLSTTPVTRLPPEISQYFITGNARYFMKLEFLMEANEKSGLVSQIIFNRSFNIGQYPSGVVEYKIAEEPKAQPKKGFFQLLLQLLHGPAG